ncbi:hypothetical protein DUI87_19996 [Hirundo rustica rustica]|uniref:dual-specificity kinase n=1 Tax=Hirundo rustica rustica TaxID=333673 RepID=A0A3M0JPZ2_HIRRU|nr:hypothetical protein DUI87_19996 [Hirundo rustica rustica]
MARPVRRNKKVVDYSQFGDLEDDDEDFAPSSKKSRTQLKESKKEKKEKPKKPKEVTPSQTQTLSKRLSLDDKLYKRDLEVALALSVKEKPANPQEVQNSEEQGLNRVMDDDAPEGDGGQKTASAKVPAHHKSLVVDSEDRARDPDSEPESLPRFIKSSHVDAFSQSQLTVQERDHLGSNRVFHQENGTQGNFPQFNLPDSLPESDPRVHTKPSELESTSIGVKLPMTASEALKNFRNQLTVYEQKEIFNYTELWFLGLEAKKIEGLPETQNNNCYDDEHGSYLKVLHDHIAYRYEVLEVIGKGSFGQVAKCLDHKTNELVALKIIRNKKRFHSQALVEVKILDALLKKDKDDTHNIIHMKEYFYFRNHFCIAFELLGINLYELIKKNNFQGFSLSLIRHFTRCVLRCLQVLYQERIIHCDLKPENILLYHNGQGSVKVIDFGSSCYEDQRVYTYVQSRFYRSPEVILGHPYAMAVDMWSLGCIIAELYTGYPLFPGENESDQLACIMEDCMYYSTRSFTSPLLPPYAPQDLEEVALQMCGKRDPLDSTDPRKFSTSGLRLHKVSIGQEPGAHCTYAEVKVKSQDTNAAANCKSSEPVRKHQDIQPSSSLQIWKAPDSQGEPEKGTLECRGKSCCSRKRVAILVVIILVLVLATYVIITCCPPPWKKHGRKCYFFSPEVIEKDWNTSREECTAMGSDLVIINSKEELVSSNSLGQLLRGLELPGQGLSSDPCACSCHMSLGSGTCHGHPSPGSGAKPCTGWGVLGLGILPLEAAVPRPDPMGRGKLPAQLAGVLQTFSTQAKEV